MISVITPKSDAQLDQVRRLIHEFVNWLRQHRPDYLHVINEYFEGARAAVLNHVPGSPGAPARGLLD